MVAHLSIWSVEFILRPSEMWLAPFGPILLTHRLRVRADFDCQRLLTAENRVCGGAPELLERRVRLEGLREVLGALRTDVVDLETVSEGEIRVSTAPDSREKGVRPRTRAR